MTPCVTEGDCFAEILQVIWFFSKFWQDTGYQGVPFRLGLSLTNARQNVFLPRNQEKLASVSPVEVKCFTKD